jgi:hypothetical protein
MHLQLASLIAHARHKADCSARGPEPVVVTRGERCHRFGERFGVDGRMQAWFCGSGWLKLSTIKGPAQRSPQSSPVRFCWTTAVI